MTSDLERLSDHVCRSIAPHVHLCQRWRIDELVALALVHWPHDHLEAILPHGRHHKGADHAMAMVRGQLREEWKNRHGIGPLWELAIDPAVGALLRVLLDLWFLSPGWRGALLVMGRTYRATVSRAESTSCTALANRESEPSS